MKTVAIALLTAALTLAGCATTQTNEGVPAIALADGSTTRGGASGTTPAVKPAVLDLLDDSAFDEASPISEDPIADPLEPWNRVWFSFNDFLFLQVFKPIYTGYEMVVHEDIRAGLSNAWRNLKAPVRIVNSILQGEFAQAVVEFGRFIVNTTAGGLGLAEIVKPEDALVPMHLESADFGGTLAKWGVGEGIYLVWPFFGPSTVRDTFGIAGDTASSIGFWVAKPIGSVSNMLNYSTDGGLRFNSLGRTIKGYEALTKAAIEPYTSVRDAYVKLRRHNALPASQNASW